MLSLTSLFSVFVLKREDVLGSVACSIVHNTIRSILSRASFYQFHPYQIVAHRLITKLQKTTANTQVNCCESYLAFQMICVTGPKRTGLGTSVLRF